jgi:hypothetical protein
MLLLLALLLAQAPATQAPATPPPTTLWDAWPRARVIQTPAPCVRHAEVVAALGALAREHPGRATLEKAGESVEGRAIHLLKVGRGPRHVLLWSQMHGDEPSATPALLDLARHLLTSSDPAARRILDELTLLMVPMLNPDGSERYARRNAQEIDVNRDALALATPEGRLLKELRDRHQPILGFNLHDQNRRTAVGDTGALASVALLAVAGDPAGTLTPGRLRAKRICSALIAALSPFVPGAIARYDEEWSPRAFGDNLTAWGTPVVLIESGGLLPGRPFTELTRLNFVGLLYALGELARDDAQAHDPAAYEALPRNETGVWSDVILRGGLMAQPGSAAPYRADIAFERRQPDPFAAGCGPDAGGSRVAEVGDARFMAAAEVIDAAGSLVVPALGVSVHGIGASTWLTPATLAGLARLGVATMRWHVPASDLAAAARHAASVAAPGRPLLAPAAEGEPSFPLTLRAAPAAARDPTLAAALDALDPQWRERLAAAPAWTAFAAARLTYDEPANLIQLRATPEGALDPATMRLERVFVDGRLVR